MQTVRKVTALALVLAGCSSAVTATTTTEFKGVPDPWPATCDRVSALDEAWQPIVDYLDEQPGRRSNGFFLQRDLPEESDQLTEALVRASVEGAALAASGDTWAEVLRQYADDVLGWFPDLLGEIGRQIAPNDEFDYDYARYGVLVERCADLGDDTDSNQATPAPRPS